MSARFEELAWSRTSIGEVSLRRRRDPVGGGDIFEVKLGEEFLMSSLFTVAEIALARMALARLPHSRGEAGLDVVVGGLGLGYTAQAVLADERVNELIVIEAIEAVIDWHRRGLVPVGGSLTADVRCRLVHEDFFALTERRSFDPDAAGRVFDAVLVDIDHSPRHTLTESTAGFYGEAGTRRLASQLRPGGCYALWSNDPPDPGYLAVLSEVFVDVAAETVSFPNPRQGRPASNTIYLATRPG